MVIFDPSVKAWLTPSASGTKIYFPFSPPPSVSSEANVILNSSGTNDMRVLVFANTKPNRRTGASEMIEKF